MRVAHSVQVAAADEADRTHPGADRTGDAKGRILHHRTTIGGHAQTICSQQEQVQINYKDMCFSETLRCDLIIDDKLLIELKAVEAILPVHKAQVLSYLKLLNLPYGLLINFNQCRLVDGVNRLVNKQFSAS